MFTFGLFSTHVPYIAFVIFYAYFLIFGVEKAAKGDISLGDHYLKTELRVSQTFIDSPDGNDLPDRFDFDFFYHGGYEDLIFKRTVIFYSPGQRKICQWDLANILFSRPPPII
jgi:hypothetical protein